MSVDRKGILKAVVVAQNCDGTRDWKHGSY